MTPVPMKGSAMKLKFTLAIIGCAGIVVEQIVVHEIKKRQKQQIQQSLANIADELFAFQKSINYNHPETSPNSRKTESDFKKIISNY